MAEINQNFSLYQGETKNLVVAITKEDGSNLDLTGCVISWALRQLMTSTTNLVTKTTADNSITVSGNVLTVHIVPNDMTSLKGSFYHECKMTDSLGNESELFNGLATILVSAL